LKKPFQENFEIHCFEGARKLVMEEEEKEEVEG
jgi:hypothetical protein